MAWKVSASFVVNKQSSLDSDSRNLISVAIQKYAAEIKTTFSNIASFENSWVFSIGASSSSDYSEFRYITFPIFKLKIQSSLLIKPRLFRAFNLCRWSFLIYTSCISSLNDIFNFLRRSLAYAIPYFYFNSLSLIIADFFDICSKSVNNEDNTFKIGSASIIIFSNTFTYSSI